MDVPYLAGGVLLLLVGTTDIVWTTLWVQGGAGPLTSRLMKGEWEILRRIMGQRPAVLTLIGPLILVASLATWIALLWGGWTLVFASSESALLDVSGKDPISWAERLYFTGYTIFTLGNGGYAPETGSWQIITIFVAGSGMLFITLTVTYVLSVLGAVTQKRAFASNVSGLGEQTDEIIRTSWDGEAFQGLELPLNTLASQLDTLTANHKAYPILHYFHSKQAKHAPVVSIVVLDELLTFLKFGTPKEGQPADLIVRNARSGVQSYLETLQSVIDPADHSPPPLDLESLREAGVPTVPPEEFTEALGNVEKRRRHLLALVKSDNRTWPNQESQ